MMLLHLRWDRIENTIGREEVDVYYESLDGWYFNKKCNINKTGYKKHEERDFQYTRQQI
jgi:hypothetical protein